MKKLSEINLKLRDRQSINAAVDLLKARFPVEEVILFGSKARGTDDPESDIDLLILTSRSITWQERHEVIDALFDVQLQYDVVISTLIIPKNEWNEGYWRVLPITEEIEKDGAAA